MKRDEFLDSVKQIICVDRKDQHGNPEDTFGRIAVLWTAYMQVRYGVPVQIGKRDVALMMNLFKVGRSCGNSVNLDNYMDMAGYAALAAELVSERE